jgi:glutamate carboxypeptidase
MIHETALINALSRRIAKHEAAMLAFVEELVNIESPTEDRDLCEHAGAMLEAKARSLGMECTLDRQTRFADNRVCRLARPSLPANAPKVLLIGHFDTVYPRGTVAQRPYRVEGTKAFGPGVVDMKSGLTAGLFALQAIQEELGALPFAATFIFNSDEEIGSPCSRDIILAETRLHDLALLLEPGLDGPDVVIGRKGVGIFTLEVDGVEAHAGVEPEKGANALVEMAHKLLAVSALADHAKGTTINPGVIAGGTQPYVVPGACRLTIDIRITSAEEQSRIESGLARIANMTVVPGTKTKPTGHFHRPPMETNNAARRYVAQLQAVSRGVGYPLGASDTGGASDGNLTAAAGTPTIDGLGPHGGRAHSPDEFMDIPTLTKKCQILAGFLATLPGTTA